MNFDHFFKTAAGVDPYEYQRQFAEASVLPDLLEAPTGSGKTATAVLGWLWRRLHGAPEQRVEAGRRLIFCLPMRTLVEQTERSVRAWVHNLHIDSTLLGVHSLMGGAADDAWEEHPDRNTILIGTQDQLLSRALMRGYAMSRYRWPVHFALLHNDCTWIMDEVQLMGVGASTAAQLQAFREQLKVAGAAKTVWMTATLSAGRLRTVDVRRDYIQQPFIEQDAPLKRRLEAPKSLAKASAVVGKKGTSAALAKEVVAAHAAGSLTLVIVNRVARAQELYELLAKESSIEQVALVHSRFRPADRRRIQGAALSGSFKGVLVATQAVEAGVDISAKTLFTELAPWPSLVQRFGRLNRAGEHTESRAIWVDIDTDDEELCLPYDPVELTKARTKVESLRDVGPRSLKQVASEPEEPALPVLRRKDLLELFDTEPDLAGRDIDISRFIRATDDRDVYVAWRTIGDGPLSPTAPDLARDELCSVPASEFKKLTKERSVWRFDGLRQRWTKVDEIFPGLTVLVDVSVGGYDDKKGFTRDKADVPTSLEAAGPAPDYDEADQLTYGAADYVTLKMHAEDTAEEMVVMLQRLEGALAPVIDGATLVEAARWHDTGKAHAAFQEMMIENLPDGDARRSEGPWAKSDGKHGAKNKRRFFRHELASALAWIAEGKSDVGAFVVAAHHGKVRMSLRARPGEERPANAPPHARFAHGICDGDELPKVELGNGVTVTSQTLSLACMELGGAGQGASWAERMQCLLSEYGPFRLAYLEMLVRVADWRASRKRATSKETMHG